MADSAYLFCQQQCDFGPRTMNSEAHELCAEWIAGKFRQYGLEVTLQKADLTGYDGTKLKSTNIIASYRPELNDRILLCAHWDSRPWADNDPDDANHRKPVMAANDGASGIAVMLEVARLLASDSLHSGVDFICFDAEDWGTPQWAESKDGDADTWALGAQYWAMQYVKQQSPNRYRYGILLDMVGGRGSTFSREMLSRRYADPVVDLVWRLGRQIGYGHYFPIRDGGYLVDDHLNVNQTAHVPCIDIVPYFTDGPSSFGPTWHTLNDTPENIDTNVLKAVGQTLAQLIYNEAASYDN